MGEYPGSKVVCVPWAFGYPARVDFGNTSFDRKRPLHSYSKVRFAVSRAIRSRRFQLSRVPQGSYLNVGCGQNVAPGFVNVDYQWSPGVLCWNIVEGLPMADGSMQGAFSEHCLEHLPHVDALRLLREIRRVLRPGSLLRLVLPDAQLYLDAYAARGKHEPLPYQSEVSVEGVYTPLMSVNRLFYVQREEAFGHQYMYDQETIQAFLNLCGYTEIQPRTFGEGAERALLIDTPARRAESLYVEARA